MTTPLSPAWQIELQDYHAACAYLGMTPKAHLYAHLTEYLAGASNRVSRPAGFSRYLAVGRLTEWRIGRLDVVTKLFIPDHPTRHILNAVIALHECDGDAYGEIAPAPSGWKTVPRMLGWGLGFAVNVAISIPWLGWQSVRYATRAAWREKDDLVGMRILISGVSRGLGKDLMLHCLERGAEVVGIVRRRESRDTLQAELAASAPVTLLVADLSEPGAAIEALVQAQVDARSIAMAIFCAGVKHEGQSVLSLPNLRNTFQVNFFSTAELAAWVCGRGDGDRLDLSSSAGESARSHVQPTAAAISGQSDDTGHAHALSSTAALVLISSMGRWHGMLHSCGYNASKAALSIWGESLDMELRRGRGRRYTVTIVEPGMFASGMTRPTPLNRLLFASRRDVASRIVSGALAGRGVIRPPLWFALLTWGVCLMGRNFRYRLFARAKPDADH